MKYQKNIHSKLLKDGFQLIDEHEENEEEYLHYFVYKKGAIEVTVCDSHKNIDIHLDAEHEDISQLSYEQLKKLSQLINQEV